MVWCLFGVGIKFWCQAVQKAVDLRSGDPLSALDELL